MNSRITLIVALLSLIAVSATSFAAVSGGTYPNPPNFYITSPITNLCRGMLNYIPIALTNTGVVSLGTPNANGPNLQSVELTVIGTRSIFAIQNSTAQIGSIYPGNSSTVSVPVFVSANASAIQSLGFNINYYFLSVYTNSQQMNLTFGTQVCPMPLSIKINPSSLTAGNIQNITLGFTNTGNAPITSLSSRISLPAQDGAWLSSQPVQVGYIAPGTSQSVKAQVLINRNASQTIPLNMTTEYYYNNKLQQTINNTQVLAAGLISLTPTSVTVSPINPSVGSIFSVSFVLTNIGTSGASAVIASPVATNGFSNFGSNSTFVGDISADSQTPVTVTMVVDNGTKPGTYKVPIKINYLNSLRQNLTTMANVTLMISAATPLNATKIYAARTGSSGGIVLTLLLLIVIAVLGYLYYKERKKGRSR